MKPTTAVTIILISVLGSLLILLSLAIFYNDAATNNNRHYLERASIIELFNWIGKLPVYQRYSVFVIAFLGLMFIFIDTIFVLWFMCSVHVSEKPIEFLQSSYKHLGKVDDIENLTPYGSEYGSKHHPSSFQRIFAGSSSTTTKKSHPRSLSIPSVYFSQETPLRESLQNSLANVRINTRSVEHLHCADLDDDDSSIEDNSRELFYNGRPIEMTRLHGKEVLIS